MPDPTPNPMDPGSLQLERDSAYEQYAKYATHLRNWFIAYGVGVPLVICNSAEAFGSKKELLTLRVLLPFLVGVCLQVLLAWVNKYANWALHADLDERLAALRQDKQPPERGCCRVLAVWVSDKIQIDVVLDLLTLAAYVWGTVSLF